MAGGRGLKISSFNPGSLILATQRFLAYTFSAILLLISGYFKRVFIMTLLNAMGDFCPIGPISRLRVSKLGVLLNFRLKKWIVI
jgi:hypothetical protein